MFESKLTVKVKTLSAIAASIDATLQKTWDIADDVSAEKSIDFIADLVETILLDTAIKAMKDIDEALDKSLKKMSGSPEPSEFYKGIKKDIAVKAAEEIDTALDTILREKF